MFIPKFILKLVRNAPSKKKPNITYTGIYSSFEEVYDKYPLSTNYNSEESSHEEFELACAKFKTLNNGSIPFHDSTNSRLNILPTFLSSFSGTHKIKILDVGGGFGTSYINLKFSCPQIETEYTIYELPEIVSQSSIFSQEHGELKFTSDFSTINSDFDIVLFSSSLQYFENYKEIINLVCNFKPKFILLTDHTMGIVDTFVCAQVNMKDRVIPRHVYNINEIISLFKTNNYELKLKSVNYHPFHNFFNYDGDYTNTTHYNLVFSKQAEN